MGDPKRIRKKYDTPSHPWIKSRIDEEKRLSREFGTKNKKELWKMETTLKKYKSQAKILIALKTDQAAVERDHLFRRVSQLGLVQGTVNYDSVLSLTSDDILSRRLQSMLVSKGLARSVKQARQFITHEHIVVGDKVITSPSYLVSVSEESQLGFAVNSPFFREEHPERAVPAKKEEEVAPKKVAEKSHPKKVKVDQDVDEGEDLEVVVVEEAPVVEASSTEEAEAPKGEAQ